MSDVEDWIDCTLVGSSYEEQLNKYTGARRHRYSGQYVWKAFGHLPVEQIQNPWKDGDSPRC